MCKNEVKENQKALTEYLQKVRATKINISNGMEFEYDHNFCSKYIAWKYWLPALLSIVWTELNREQL